MGWRHSRRANFVKL